jgi:hypothetical protein
MSEDITSATSRMALSVLRPLVRVLLKLGFSYGAFSEIARQAFVLEGFVHANRHGSKSTGSAVAALTGLSRKEIRRLSQTATDDLAAAATGRARAVRVLGGWTTDERFCTDNEPRVLSLDAIDGGFQSLVESYSGDVTPIAMLGVLEQAGCIERVAGGVALIRNAYLPMATPTERLNILGTDVAELIETIAHNIDSPEEHRMFQRKVSVQGLSAANLAEFQAFSNERSQALLEEYDRWLADRLESQSNQSTDENRDVSVGIFFHTPFCKGNDHEQQ